MAANAFLLDATSRHQLGLQRLAGGNFNEVKPLLQSLRDRLQARIARDDISPEQFVRQQALLADVNDILAEFGEEVAGTVDEQVQALAAYEAGFTQRMLSQAATVTVDAVSAEAVVASLTDQPMRLLVGKAEQSLTVNRAVEVFTDSARSSVANAIRQGFIAGESTQEVSRRVSRMVSDRTASQAEALVRTTTAHVASVARQETYRANADVMAGERWTSTFDARTTQVCASLDGRLFPVGEGPQAPRHFRCRSLRTPEIREEFQADIDGDGRRTSEGDVGPSKTFGGWLKDQPVSFQREYFDKFTDGEERYRLFKQGGLNMQSFTDARGAVYTLDELRALEPQAFERAGL